MDRNGEAPPNATEIGRCPLRGGVDRNAGVTSLTGLPGRCPLRGGVDRNLDVFPRPAADLVAPCAGAWIETVAPPLLAQRGDVAPCAGAWIETVRRRA